MRHHQIMEEDKHDFHEHASTYWHLSFMFSRLQWHRVFNTITEIMWQHSILASVQYSLNAVVKLLAFASWLCFILPCQLSSFLMVTSYTEHTRHVLVHTLRFFRRYFVAVVIVSIAFVWFMLVKLKWAALNQIYNSSSPENNFRFRKKKLKQKKKNKVRVFLLIFLLLDCLPHKTCSIDVIPVYLLFFLVTQKMHDPLTVTHQIIHHIKKQKNRYFYSETEM